MESYYYVMLTKQFKHTATASSTVSTEAQKDNSVFF